MERGATDSRRRVVAVGAVLMLVAGCGTDAPAGTVAQPRFDGGDGAMSASFDGTLAGSADHDGGCVWLEHPDGETSAVAWATPVFLRAEDMALVDGEGDVLANMGDRVLLGGGYASGQSVDRCMVSDDLIHAWSVYVEGPR